jgi:molybdopterin molybdotransferase
MSLCNYSWRCSEFYKGIARALKPSCTQSASLKKAGHMERHYSAGEIVDVETACQIVRTHAKRLAAELVSLDESAGRVLAHDVISDIDIAGFENSAMDGFALRCEDVQQAGADAPVNLRIIGHIGAGTVFEGVVTPGSAVRIMTGAPLPAGADSVIKIEDVEVRGRDAGNPAGSEVCVRQEVSLGANVRLRGEEAKAGELVMRTGERITSAGIGLLAATGNVRVQVYRRPRVAIFSTGSELVDASEVPGPGQIRNSNSHALAAFARDAGAEVDIVPKVHDTLEALKLALQAAAASYDVVVFSGGAAEGDFDYTVAAVRELGTILFSKVNMRPGKAQTFGTLTNALLFGLSGNPAAAAVGFEILVRPALRQMQGLVPLTRPMVYARLTTDITKKEVRRSYLRASLVRDEHGALSATPARRQSSALYSVLHESNCFIVVPEGGVSLCAGDKVQCLCTTIGEGGVV